MRRFLALAVLLFSLPSLGQVTVLDQAGREVTIPQPVERVVSLYGVATFYLYALGVEDKLVLGTYVGLKPGSPSWEALAQLDPDLPEKYTRTAPSLEEVLLAAPDLVIASAVKNPELPGQLAPFGIPALLIQPESVEGVQEATSLVGAALGAENRAQALISYWKQRMGAVSATDLARPRVLFVGTSPLRVASGDMYQSEMIALAGGDPVTHDLQGYWQDVNIEQILLWDPEVVFIAPYGPVQPADLLADPAWRGVAAIRDRQVFKLPRVFAPWDIPTPESLLGIMWMAKALHPGLPMDPVAEARTFYQEFFGYPLPEGMIAGPRP